MVSVYQLADTDEVASKGKYRALGLIETFGIVFALEAADAMCKAADVELIGFENVASGYISVLVRGDVGACKASVETGIQAVTDMGAEVYSSVVIASPHQELEKIIGLYSLETLNP
ncbi:BMC domain-containing protein [Clostridium sp.]|uniref:BMC domain-containing protein n=1 Tax=Clostridium sp. TaxID=1506 RepID=UPI003D6D2ACC